MKKSLAAGAAIGLASSFSKSSWARIIGANDEIRMGIVGFHNKGAQHIDVFHSLPGVRVVALCDVDRDILAEHAKQFTDRGEKVDTYVDVRKLLEDKNIDAICVATPNHWHSLITIWACQAGKDVYVEKPISHNVWEGRKAVEAARKYKRIVQAGTQNRSDVGLREAVKYLREGHLGKILWAHGVWYKLRESIGYVTEPQPIPESVDYNLWTGPARLEPLMRKRLHYDWHWFWNTGNGDMGNLGVHQIDDCRFLLNLNELPRRIMSLGGRFGYKDNGQTPNTQLAFFDYPSTPILIEIRTLPMKKGIRAMDHLRGVRMGNVIQCEGGYFAGGRGGGWIYDNDGNKIKQFPGDGGGGHQANFIQAVRERKPERLHADIEQGHISSSLCHFANISYRIGRGARPEEILEVLKENKEATETFERIQKHLAANEVDISKHQITLGSWLDIDSRHERVRGEFKKRANKYLTRDYRKPFVVPKKV